MLRKVNMGFLARLLPEGGSSGESLTKVKKRSLQSLNNNAPLPKYSYSMRGVSTLQLGSSQ